MSNRSDSNIMPIILEHTNVFTTQTNQIHFPHTHEHLELYLHIAGNATYMVENGIYPVEYGTVVISRENELHCLRVEEDCLIENFYFGFERELFEDFCPELLECFLDRSLGERSVVLLPHNIADKCVLLMYEAIAAKRLGSRAEKLSFIMLILTEVNRIWKTQDFRPLPPDRSFSASAILLGRALSMIMEHYNEIPTANELAARLYVSREHLSRCFMNGLGIPVGKYLLMKRIQMSMLFLKQGMELSEVCSQCGWNDYSYFISVFRKETGQTPAKFRRSFKANNGN